MIRVSSIRVRLTLWYATVLLLGLALFGAGLWIALEGRLIAGLDSRLEQRMQGLRTVLEIEGGGLERKQLREELGEFMRETPEGGLIELRDSQGWLLPASKANAEILTNGSGYVTEKRNGRKLRVLRQSFRVANENYEAVVAGSLDEVATLLRDFRALLLMMIPAVLAVGCAGGYWISRTALAPVDEITRVAKSIGVQSLSQRLPVGHTGDEIQRMSEAWNEVLERLDAAVKRIRQFTADASHELRTPLAFIRATSELALRRNRSAGEYQHALIEISNEAERMTELTESLLTLARSDDGNMALALTPIDLNELVRDVIRQNATAACARNIQLKTDLAHSEAIAAANAPAIRRLLLTLIDNAMKHTPSGGEVTVSTKSAEGLVTVAVEDTGEGIQPDALPHIFERFFRADTARGSGNGVGLGLSIAQAIAQAHGSRIAVHSEPGAGSRFAFQLRA